MSFFRNAASVFATSVVNIPIQLATSIVLTRWLSVEDRGLYAVAVTFAGIVPPIVGLGWPSASIYRLRRVRSAPAQVASAALIQVFVISLLVVATCLALQDRITHAFLSDAPQIVLLLALATIPFSILADSFSGIARGLDRFALQNGHRIASGILGLVTMILALVVAGGGLLAALVAMGVTIALPTIVLTALVLRQTGIALRLDLGEITDALRFGVKSHLQTIAGQLHERADVFMLAALLRDPAQVAIYTVAVGIIQRLKLVPEAVGSAMVPHISGMPNDQAAHFTCYVSRHSIMWVVVAVLGLAVVGPFLVVLMYGQEYRASSVPLLILLPGMGLLTIYRVFARYFTALNRHSANIISQTITTILNIGLNFLWIPRYGVAGAALASFASYTVEAVLIVLAFRWDSGARLADMFVPRAADALPYRRRIDVAWRRLRAVGQRW